MPYNNTIAQKNVAFHVKEKKTVQNVCFDQFLFILFLFLFRSKINFWSMHTHLHAHPYNTHNFYASVLPVLSSI